MACADYDEGENQHPHPKKRRCDTAPDLTVEFRKPIHSAIAQAKDWQPALLRILTRHTK
ncbi:MAG TPA: hypothetical protein VKT53_05205 [Candidatus Acidoferrum sp.]|nr:hypothetical protein [Candidatus Acidoferrum sp.]